jgi:C1A family cysteine protease
MEKSPLDLRDFKAETVFRSIIPASQIDLRPQLTPIRNQKSTSMCCAFATCCLKELQERKDINMIDYFSPEFIYSYRTTPIGMHGRDAMDILLKRGVCFETSYPFQKRKESYADDEATNFKISKYCKISTIEECKQALTAENVCLVSLPFYFHDTVFWKGTVQSGGHAVAFVGYNEEGFILRNSWGTKWGENGYTIFPYSDWGLVWDVYVAYDEISVEIKRKDQIVNKKCCTIM